MTQEKKNGKIIAIITMIFLFGMISFVTNLAAPMGIVLKNQFDVSNALGMLGNFGNFIAYAVMGIPSGILLQRVGYKKTALIAVAIRHVSPIEIMQYLYYPYLLGVGALLAITFNYPRKYAGDC